MYDIAALYEAASVQDAVALRLAHPEAQILAGGTDVLVQVRNGKRAGKELISIFGLNALRGVTMEDDGTIRIGSLTSFSHITKSPIIQEHFHTLGDRIMLFLCGGNKYIVEFRIDFQRIFIEKSFSVQRNTGKRAVVDYLFHDICIFCFYRQF